MPQAPAVVTPDLQDSSRFIALATAGAVVYSIGITLFTFYRIAYGQIDQGRARYALVALACYLPLQVWLVLSTSHDVGGKRRGLAWAAMAAVVIGMVPVIGVGWLGTLYPLAAMALVSFRRPWSFVLFGAIVVTPTPVAFALGHPQWATYFTIGLPLVAFPLAVGVWLIRAARQLEAARLALAHEAVVRERLNIDVELRRTLGAALEAVTAQGARAAAIAILDPSRAADELRALVGTARATAADARRMVRQFQEVSLDTELQTAARLLSAEGIQTEIVLPPGETA